MSKSEGPYILLKADWFWSTTVGTSNRWVCDSTLDSGLEVRARPTWAARGPASASGSSCCPRSRCEACHTNYIAGALVMLFTSAIIEYKLMIYDTCEPATLVLGMDSASSNHSARFRMLRRFRPCVRRSRMQTTTERSLDWRARIA